MREFLLRSVEGESKMLKNLSFLTETDVHTQDEVWCLAGPEHSINPFGKLIKQRGTINKKTGKPVSHRKYFHGFFVNLICTEKFYNRNKEELDKYILSEDENATGIHRDNQPQWY